MDILNDLRIKVYPARVFKAVSILEEINNWWTLECAGKSAMNENIDYILLMNIIGLQKLLSV